MSTPDRAGSDTRLAWLIVGASAALTLVIAWLLLGFVGRQVNGWATAQVETAR